MQEIKKRRIVIASVLKPVDDTRMFEKIAISLSGLYAVHLIGFESGATNNIAHPASVSIHSLGRFNRLSMKRLFTPLRVIRKAFAINPDLIIITTHELLGVASLLRILTGCKIIYDVQENYARNIYHGQSVAAFLRWPIAVCVRLREWLLSMFVTHFFLSEKSYANELGFIGDRHTVLQNKLTNVPTQQARRPLSVNNNIKLIFSGTLAPTTGVFAAIDLAIRLHGADARIELCIIGYASQEAVRARIKSAVSDKPFIEVIGLDRLVEHTTILDRISACDFGVVSYPFNLSTHAAFPTKLFEYLGYRLPILLVDNPEWVDYCKPYDAAVVFTPETVDPKVLLHEMLSKQFYTRFPEDVFWRSEEGALMQVVAQALQ